MRWSELKQWLPQRPDEGPPLPRWLTIYKEQSANSETPIVPSQSVATGCIPCSRGHLATISGALAESLRFARDGGVEHPEVQRRILLAEQELNMMERIDLAPDALERSPAAEKQLALDYLPRIRKLRQDIEGIDDMDMLQKVAADATVLGQEFRSRALQLRIKSSMLQKEVRKRAREKVDEIMEAGT